MDLNQFKAIYALLLLFVQHQGVDTSGLVDPFATVPPPVKLKQIQDELKDKKAAQLIQVGQPVEPPPSLGSTVRPDVVPPGQELWLIEGQYVFRPAGTTLAAQSVPAAPPPVAVTPQPATPPVAPPVVAPPVAPAALPVESAKAPVAPPVAEAAQVAPPVDAKTAVDTIGQLAQLSALPAEERLARMRALLAVK